MQHLRLNKPSAPRTLNAAYARLLVAHLLQARPDAASVLDDAQRAWLDQHDPLARCSLQAWHRLMDLAEQQLDAPDLVPVLADQFKPWHAGLLGFTLMTSPSVGKVAGALRRLHHLLNDVFVVEFGVQGERFFLGLRQASVADSPRLARLSLCIWAQRLRWLTGQADLRLEAHFQGPAPADVAPYRRLFGGAVRFEQADNAMWGDVALVDMPVVSHDNASHALLRGQAHKQLEALSSEDDRLVNRLHSVVSAHLNDGRLSLDEVAAQLGLPARTLQRRLEEVGLNFRQVVDGVRQAVAEQYLRDQSRSLVETAAALGFSDHASFNRAFKRWTGQSPGAFRRHATQAGR